MRPITAHWANGRDKRSISLCLYGCLCCGGLGLCNHLWGYFEPFLGVTATGGATARSNEVTAGFGNCSAIASRPGLAGVGAVGEEYKSEKWAQDALAKGEKVKPTIKARVEANKCPLGRWNC